MLERIHEIRALLVDALEELEAGHCEATPERLVELGDALLALSALVNTVIRMVELGDEKRSS